MIISVVNTKGGAGKTTTALMLALALSRRGSSVEVWDADAQGSAVGWADRVSDAPFGVIPVPQSRIDRSRVNTDFVVIDTPPGGVGVVQAAIDAADVVLVPTIIGSFDLDRVLETLSTTRHRPSAVLVCSAEPNTRLHRAAIELLDEQQVPVMSSMILKRQQIRELFASGQVPEGLYDYDEVLSELDEALSGQVA